MDIKCAIGRVGPIFNPLESADVQTPSVQVSAASKWLAISHLAIGLGNVCVIRGAPGRGRRRLASGWWPLTVGQHCHGGSARLLAPLRSWMLAILA